jgi:hypothetical protein
MVLSPALFFLVCGFLQESGCLLNTYCHQHTCSRISCCSSRHHYPQLSCTLHSSCAKPQLCRVRPLALSLPSQQKRQPLCTPLLQPIPQPSQAPTRLPRQRQVQITISLPRPQQIALSQQRQRQLATSCKERRR